MRFQWVFQCDRVLSVISHTLHKYFLLNSQLSLLELFPAEAFTAFMCFAWKQTCFFGLIALQSIIELSYSPVNPSLQVQMQPLVMSLHMPKFIQGLESHSLLLTSQFVPLQPESQSHLYLYKQTLNIQSPLEHKMERNILCYGCHPYSNREKQKSSHY